MNCTDIRAVLDNHRLATLSRAERNQVDTHLAGCAACFDATAVHELLWNESVGLPRAELRHRIIAAAGAAVVVSGRERAGLRWPTVAAAAGLVLAVTLFWAVQGYDGRPEEATVPESVAGFAGGPREAAPFVDGQHFVSVPMSSPLTDLGERLSAWVFFMWSCLHCYELEALLPEWMAAHESDAVEIRRVPVQWNAVAELHARAFYAAERLGVAERVNTAFYREIQESQNPLQSRDAIARLFRDAGVDDDEFAAAFDSREVDAELESARRLAAVYSIDATPTLIVNGVYKTNPGMAGSHERMLEVADWLLSRDRDAVGRICDPARLPCR